MTVDPAPLPYIIKAHDCQPSPGPGLTPITYRMRARRADMRLLEKEGKGCHYVLFDSRGGVISVSFEGDEAISQSFAEWRELAETKRNPRAVYMMYLCLSQNVKRDSVSKSELIAQLRAEYAVDIGVVKELGIVPPVDDDYQRAMEAGGFAELGDGTPSP